MWVSPSGLPVCSVLNMVGGHNLSATRSSISRNLHVGTSPGKTYATMDIVEGCTSDIATLSLLMDTVMQIQYEG